jgi:hypothetical protein
MEKHMHVIEAVINADATRFFGIEKADDMYHSIDLLAKSIEKQASKHKSKHTGHKAVSPAKAEQPELKPEKTASLIYRRASDKPKDEIEAFLEMKMEKRDFILFKKFKKTKKLDYEENFALIYKNDGGFKLVETPMDLSNEKKPFNKLTEFDIIIKKDSLTKPELKFKKCRGKSIKNLAVIDAIEEIMDRVEKYLPFFNNETNHLNVILKSEKGIELISPPK